MVAVTQLSEPTLWTIVVVLAGIVAKGGLYVFRKLNDCEEDREVLHRNCAKLATAYAASTGQVITLEEAK